MIKRRQISTAVLSKSWYTWLILTMLFASVVYTFGKRFSSFNLKNTLNCIPQFIKIFLVMVHMYGYSCPHLSHEQLHAAVDAKFLLQIKHEVNASASIAFVNVGLYDVVMWQSNGVHERGAHPFREH